MKARLTALHAKIAALYEAASNIADSSENDDTIARYEAIADALDGALTCVREAIETFD